MQLLNPPWVNHDEGQAIFSVDIHPDGSRFATGGQGQGQDASGRVVIWNMKPVISEKHEEDNKCPKLLCQLDQHLGCVNCVRWSHSGTYLASAGDDKVVIIWQLSSFGGGSVFGSNVVNVEWWRCVSTLRGHDGDILDVAWAPHDTYLASASIDNTVIIWNCAKWPERVRVLRGHRGLVKGVSWDPVGRYVASQSDDKTLIVWRTTDWQQETVVTKPFEKCGGTTSVLRPSWSPDGQYLVSAHAMNNGGPTAQIIDRDHWTTETDFVGHRKPVTCVRFNPNILRKVDPATGKNVRYCCLAVGSRDRSISVWFTSLKRPLVVLHGMFEDSVLDLAFSGCGRYLLAVSKDGSLAAITFTNEEMGQSLSKQETDSVYLKLYGKCNSSNNIQASAATIIDNPELLKAREHAKTQQQQQQQQQQQLNSSERSLNSSMQRGPDKQIERRTADGRRRITPVFIPPSADGVSMKTFASFSTSSQEKSRIVIEKLDGVVEPNVTTPHKQHGFNNTSSNSNTPVKATAAAAAATPSTAPDAAMRPPSELDGVNPGLAARLERVGKHQEKSGDAAVPTSITSAGVSMAVKHKLDDAPQPIVTKRKRGRPPLDRSQQHPSTPSSPPPVSAPQQQIIAKTPAASSALSVAAPAYYLPVTGAARSTHLVSRNILPPAALGATHRLHAATLDGSGTLSITVENNWREVAGGGTSVTGRCLHRVTAHCSGGEWQWTHYTTTPVVAAASGNSFLALACSDGTLHLLCSTTGSQLWPAVQGRGVCSRLCAVGDCVMLLSCTAHLSLYDVAGRNKPLDECVRHLVEGRVSREGVRSIHLIKCSQLQHNEESPVGAGAAPPLTNGAAPDEISKINKKSLVNGNHSAANVNQNDSSKSKRNDKENDLMETDAEEHGSKSMKNGYASNKSGSVERTDASLPALERLTPAVVLGSGEVFARCRHLESWLQLGECSEVRRVIMAQYAALPPASTSLDAPLASLLRYTNAFVGTTRGDRSDGSCGSELRTALTETFLKKMLSSAAYLSSTVDFSFWYQRLVHFYIREGNDRCLRGVFDELLSVAGINNSASASSCSKQRSVFTVMPEHQHLLPSDRLALLRSYLDDLLILDTSDRLQRLYTEYREQLDTTNETPVDVLNDIML